ncbi:MAG TPA: FtsX-like permease family protein [Iamia sp.]
MPRLRAAGDAARRWLRVVTSPPWRRAPLLVGRSPALAVGVAVAAFVLGLAGASRPLFSASAGRASLHQDLEEGCPFEVGLRVERAVPLTPGGDPLAAGGTALDDAVGPIEGVAPAVVSVFGGTATVAPAGAEGGETAIVQLLHRDGFADHVEVVAGGDGPGAWVPDTVAEPLGLAPGDEIALVDGEGVTLPVTAVYRDLREGRDDWWCSLRYTFEARSAGGFPPPPVVMVGDDLPAVVADAGGGGVLAWWEYPPDTETWDLATATRATASLRAVADRTNDRVSDLALALGPGTSTVDRPASVDKAEGSRTAVESVAGPVAWGTIGVALTMLLTAARSWLSRRSQQVTVLTLRGAGPVAVGLKAVGELLPAVVVGGAAGLGAALAVVRYVAPDPMIEGGALVEGLVVVGLATMVAVVAVIVVVATGARRVGVGSGGAAPRRTLLPWEPVVLAGAVAALYEVQSRPAEGDGRIDGLLLVFPLLLLAGGSGVAARLVLSRRVLAAAARRAPTAGWLAARRLAAGRARVSLIVTGAAISIGIVVFAGATSASVRATADAKAVLGDGARQIVRLSVHDDLPTEPPIPGSSTLVTRTTESSVLRAGHDRADVLGVDPDSFADAAFWDDSFAGRSLGSLLDAITLPPDADPAAAVSIVAVGDGLPDRFVITVDGEDGPQEIGVRVVARADAFPGFQADRPRPLVVLDRAALDRVGVVELPEVWLSDDSASIPDRLEREGLTIIYSRRAATDVTGTLLQPQVWAIDYLEVIGLAAGLVTVAGLGLHFAADAERRRLGAALARRLGLSSRQVTGATVVEVAAILLGGLVLGVGLAWTAVRLVFRKLDPVPQTAPDPLLRYDIGLVGVCVVAALAVAVVVTLVVERRSARSSLPELLRAAR